MPDSDYSVPLSPDRKYTQRTVKRQMGCKVPDPLWLSAMDHSRTLSVIWGEELTEKIGEKNKMFLASAL